MNPDPTSLDRLHDIVEPLPVPWWPPAPGWYWVLGFVTLLVVGLGTHGVIQWQRNRYRREALAECRRLRPQLTTTAGLTALAELLKRTALTAFPRRQVAALSGTAWLAFLDRTAALHEFTSEAGAALEQAAYDSSVAARIDEAQANAAADLARRWINHHRVENGDTEC